MQPTVPAWVSWYRRLRPGELPRARAPARPAARAPARLALYTGVFNARDDTNLHLIRLDDMLGNKHLLPTPPNQWLKRLNINADMWRAHIAPEITKHSLDYQQRFHNYSPVSLLAPPANMAGGAGPGPGAGALAGGVTPGVRGGGPGGGGGGHGAGGGAVWGGWAAGAVLLALLVLIVRAAEKCLDRRLFKTRRRRSDEWPTPNVIATSLQQQNIDGGSVPHLDEHEYASPSRLTSDLPPPYSECAPSDTNINKSYHKDTEEPPPPYSACLVAFSNKDIPTVHIHTQRDTRDTRNTLHSQPHTSTDTDNIHNDLIESRRRVPGEQGTMRVELVFDNGRVVERTIDVNSTDNVPAIVADVGETVIGGGSTDDVTIICDVNDLRNTGDVTEDGQERVIMV
ncbi:uncharacterized protein LOC142983195 [Anticarsia gemmatalis]|uniref:uncharacterized protein LOC142983195 n=1 Tax=Anticarsia gemmatalis TaxID=129554 RepID=UPI003F75A787